MKNILLILSVLLLAGCHTLTIMCNRIAPAQADEAIKIYGKENVEEWLMINNKAGKYNYHKQVKIRINGVWYWADNHPYTVVLDKNHNPNCKPYKKIR